MLETVLLVLLVVVLILVVRHAQVPLKVALTDASLPAIPTIRGSIPFIGCGLDFIKCPGKFFNNLRDKYGETFVVYIFGVRMLCTFSPRGLQSLYGIRESEASFTEATKGLLSLKLPQELLGEPNLIKFHKGLRMRFIPSYLAFTSQAVRDFIDDRDDMGSIDIFPTMKGLVHKIGFLCWIGPSATTKDYMPRLIKAYEALDPESGFQNLASLSTTFATQKLQERRAIDELEAILKEIWQSRSGKSGEEPEDNLASLHELHKDLPEKDRYRHVAYDVFHFHLASQANMYAALSWTLVNLLVQDGKHLKAVMEEAEGALARHGEQLLTSDKALEELKYLEAFIQETLRLAQQSITLRKVMKPCELVTEAGSIQVPEGFYLATLLSVTNVDKRYLGSDVETFDPTRFMKGGRDESLERFVSSTFGHGFHACPGKLLALSIMKICILGLVGSLSFKKQFAVPRVPESSVGAIARVAEPCIALYQKRAEPLALWG